ncbi:hydantoinase/oxoprolinase family protein [Microbacterium sp. NPDC078428]|uniref:hydantoinase/oxoprolinase family protein n=1 Tax=Microbacterium sp. NPDC078428 TaxID=3364190 RepID=UPI0037C8366F
MTVSFTVGIDVGGTFTDFVAIPHGIEQPVRLKVSSTPSDPSAAVEEGLRRLLGLLPIESEITSITHGTTIGLNALIQRAGGKVALVVSRGFRDIFEIARSRMPSSWDLHASIPEPLVNLESVIEIDARLDQDGNVLKEVSDEDLKAIAANVQKIAPEALVLNLLNGYKNVDYTDELATRIGAQLGGLPMISATKVWPEIREYERSLVAVMGAHIHGLMSAYFTKLKSRVEGLGIEAPLFIAGSNGGTLALESAMERPLDTVLSGPASGVTAARLHYPGESLITFDMGGTSSDISIVVGGNSQLSTSTEIGGLEFMMPVVDVNAIGAGGGSVIWADESGSRAALRVGPMSAGAFPGPACYGQGGERVAITDAYLTSGIISAGNFLGGAMKLDVEAARAGLAEVADTIGIATQDADPAVQAADAGLRLATAQMSATLQKLLAERALDPREFTLVPFGGAGPTHAAMIAEELGIEQIRIPDAAATYCALGAALAPLRRDLVNSVRALLDERTAQRCRDIVTELAAEGREWLREGGDNPDLGSIEVTVDMRHPLQAYELSIELGEISLADIAAGRPLDFVDNQKIRDAFNAEHTVRYGFANTDAPLEIGTLRVAVIGQPPLGSEGNHIIPDNSNEPAPVAVGSRPIRWRETWIDASIYSADTWEGKGSVDGSAVIELSDTTVLVPPNWTARVLENKDILLTWKGDLA